MAKLDFLKKIDKNNVLVGVAVIGIIVAAVLIAGPNTKFQLPSIFGASSDQIGKNALDYINKNGLTSSPAELVSATEESGLIKIKIKIGTNEFDSYVSKDGKLLFPQAIDMGQSSETANNTDSTANTNLATPETVQKSDNPALEAYVVSACPFGLQMQRAMAEAVKNIPSLGQYMKVRYIGAVSGNTITSMHGDEEAKENLNQICIREEQADKYWNYVSCFMKAGDDKGCLTSTGVDTSKLNSCVSDTSRGVAYAKQDFDKNTEFNIQGSPTLVLNNSIIDETSFGGRSSDGVKKMVCGGFNSPAGFCSTTLNTASAASSYSETYEGAGSQNSDASCN